MKKRGFTLVELLAVIVILAIIALITIPIVLKTISNSEINAEKQSISGYADAIEQYTAEQVMLNPGTKHNDYLTDNLNDNLNYKGNYVECDYLEYVNDSKLQLISCFVKKNNEEILTDEQIKNKNHYNYYNGQVYTMKEAIEAYAKAIENNKSTDFDYKGIPVTCSEKSYDNNKAVLSGCYVTNSNPNYRKTYGYQNGKATEEGSNTSSGSDASGGNNNNTTNTSNYTAYSVGDMFTIHGDGYHVIVDSPINQDYVVALKDEPLTVEEINANKIGSDGINHVNRYSGSGSVGVAYDYVGDGSVGGVAYYSSENCGYINGSGIYDGCTTSYDDSDIKHVVDKYASTTFYSNELKTIGDYKARLPEKEELRQIGWIHCASTATWCTEESSTPSWLYNWEYGYWTMSGLDNSSEFVWSVDHHGGYLVHYSVGSEIGIRPVINIYKSAIPSQ